MGTGQPITMRPYDPTNMSDRRLVRRIGLRLLPVMILLFTCGYLDRLNIGIAALQMGRDLPLNAKLIGLATGLFSVTYTILQLPSNLALKRVGASRWFCLLAVAWGLVTIATAFIRTPNELLLSRAALGVCEAGIYPGLIYYISLWFPEELRARVLFLTLLPVAAVLGTPMSGAILQFFDHFGGLSGWRWMFIMEGAPSIVIGIVAGVVLTSWPHEAKWLSAAEKTFVIETTGRQTDDGGEGGSTMARVRSVAFDGTVLALGVSYACVVSGFTSMQVFMPQILATTAAALHIVLHPFQTSLLTAIPYIVSTIGAWFWTQHSDQTGERRWHCAIATIVGAISIVAAALSTNVYILVFSLVLAMFGISASLSVMWQLAIRARPPSDTSIVAAVVNTIGSAWLIAVPFVVGVLRDASGSYFSALLFIAALMTFGAALSLFIRHTDNRAGNSHFLSNQAEGALPKQP